MKVGILGGTFNPPHLGHLIIAQEAKDILELDKIMFIPTNIPPHKQNDDIDSQQRLEMVKLSIEGEPFFKALDLEIKRGGISYTIDTVRELKAKFTQDKFYLIVGSDLANTFSTWKDFFQLKELINIVVIQRTPFPLREKDNFIIIETTQVDISSSQIREKIKQGKSIKYLVRDKVADYIKEYRLYRD